MNEEKLGYLKCWKKRRSPLEAMELLEALGRPRLKAAREGALRIRVYESGSSEPKVNERAAE